VTRKETIRINHQESTLLTLGFTRDEAEALRRISMTLQRWFKHECNGTIQRDGENGDGKPYWYSSYDHSRLGPVADREAGARRRLTNIITTCNGRRHAFTAEYVKGDLMAYIQTDPRGAALYIIRPGDVPEGGDVSAYYTRGICVY
jgi:hypothetical protein